MERSAVDINSCSFLGRLPFILTNLIQKSLFELKVIKVPYLLLNKSCLDLPLEQLHAHTHERDSLLDLKKKLCFSNSKQVLCLQFAGQNYLFWDFCCLMLQLYGVFTV